MKIYKKALSLTLVVVTLLIQLTAFAGCTDTSQKPDGGTGSANTSESETPGQLTPVINEEDPQLAITEVMVQNNHAAKAPDGEYRPWIEFYAKSTLNLGDYSLRYSDTEAKPLPNIRLEAGQYYVLFAYAEGFNVPMGNAASLTLMHGELVSQYFVYINNSANCSYLVSSSSECSTPTPGYENALPADRLTISELMCDNKHFPVDGVIGDWVEIYNAGEHPVDLSNYFLSDKPEDPYISKLPEITLGAGQYTVLRSDLEFSFGLSSGGEIVSLTRNDGVVCSLMAYQVLEENTSMTPEGVSTTPSPGYPNGKQGMLDSIFARKGLVINEVLSSNSKYKALNKEYYDLVEIYNGSAEAINLGEYYLSDKAKNLTRYKLPDVTLGAGKYYVVYCTGEGGANPEFSISSSGESMILTREDGYVTDALGVPYLTHNTSYGRGSGELLYYSAPTIGAANGKGYGAIAEAPTASVSSGEFNGSVAVTLSGKGKIYYTTNGTKPSTSSKLYAGETITFTKTGSVRMLAVDDNCVNSPESSCTYVITNIDYSLPVIAVSVDNDSVFGAGGVNETSEKTELDARVTYFVDGKEEFSQGCGIKIFGGMTRFYVKKSFQLKFRGKYGASELNYKVFDDVDNTVFNSLVIRSGGQSLLNNHINDELGTSLASTSGRMPNVLVQAYKPVNFYINDTYMGVYFLREKIDEEFVASHLGVSPESCTVIDYMNAVKYGADDAGWKELWSFIKTKDLTVPENYEYVISKIDIDSIVDFYTMVMWANNTDCGNVRIARSTEGDGKWRFILFDMDLSNGTNYSGAQTYIAEYSPSSKPYNALIWKLLQNDTFLAYFNERFEMHLSTTLAPETVNARIDFIYAQLVDDMPHEIARWKSLNSKYNQSLSEWNQYIKKLRTRRATEEYVERFRKEVAEHIADLRGE